MLRVIRLSLVVLMIHVAAGVLVAQNIQPLVGLLEARIPQLMQTEHVPGLSMVLIRENQIVWKRSFGVRVAGKPEKVDDQTIFEAASMSKPLCTYRVLKLVEDGRFDLDRPLDSYLPKPYLPDQPLAAKITARMVMLHRTGLPNWRKGGWRAGGPLPVRQGPGTRFGYSGEGYLYLQTVIEHLIKEPLDAWMQRSLLAPLEMTRSSYEWHDAFTDNFAGGHDKNGHFKKGRRFYKRGNAAYSLYTTPTDYARFLIEMMRRDRTAQYSLKAETIGKMTTLQVEPEKDNPRSRRALGWVVDTVQDGGWVTHSGSNGSGFQCNSRFNMKRQCGSVIMTNSANGRKVWEAILALIDSVPVASRSPGENGGADKQEKSTTWGPVQRTIRYDYRLMNPTSKPATKIVLNVPLPLESARQNIHYLHLPERGQHRAFTDEHGQRLVQYTIDRLEPGQWVDLGYVVGITLSNMYVLSGLCRLAGLPTRCVGGSTNGFRDLPTTDAVYHRWTEAFLTGYGWFPADCSRDANPIRGKRSHFGRVYTDVMVWCHQAGGEDDTLGWDYRAKAHVRGDDPGIHASHRTRWFRFHPEQEVAAAYKWLLDGTGARPEADVLECALLRWHEASVKSRQRLVQALAAAGRNTCLRWAAVLPEENDVRDTCVRRLCATSELADTLLEKSRDRYVFRNWFKSNESSLVPVGAGQFKLAASAAKKKISTTTASTKIWLNRQAKKPNESRSGRAVLVAGGDTVLARWEHDMVSRNGYDWPLAGVKSVLSAADAALCNLECCVSLRGMPVNKGEHCSFYYRARPEMLRCLTCAGIDVVNAANNHGGDYGPLSVADTAEWCARAGLVCVGSGADPAAAEQPRLIRVGSVRLGIAGMDSTTSSFRAEANRPGTSYVAEGEDLIAFAKKMERLGRWADGHCDLLVLTLHWGSNWVRETQPSHRAMARIAFKHGVDLILGHSAHRLQGIEIIDGKVVVYDMGNLLFDCQLKPEGRRCALFRLHLAANGVDEIEVLPTQVLNGHTVLAKYEEARQTLVEMRGLCATLGTQLEIDEDIAGRPVGLLRVPNPQTTRRRPPNPDLSCVTVPINGANIQPMVPASSLTDRIPQDACELSTPAELAPGVELVAYRLPDTADEGGILFISTWWRVTKPVAPNSMLAFHLSPQGETPRRGTPWYTRHDAGDWTVPLARLQPGTMIADRYPARLAGIPAGPLHVHAVMLDTTRPEASRILGAPCFLRTVEIRPRAEDPQLRQ